jgi:Holliday junction DNA helicase RuvA
MIGYLSGTVRGIVRGSLIVEVNNVGYRLFTTAATLASSHEGNPMTLWTHLAVRENSQDLFGFETKDELSWFELLITVSGVGPKSALAVLNAVDIRTLGNAIARNDPSALSRAFGVGKKTAEKIVLELREKVGSADEKSDIPGSDGDVVDALEGLGYSVREARDAVRSLPKDLDGTEARIREAIRIASRGS